MTRYDSERARCSKATRAMAVNASSIHAEFAVQHAFGNQEGELHHVPLRIPPQFGTHRDDLRRAKRSAVPGPAPVRREPALSLAAGRPRSLLRSRRARPQVAALIFSAPAACRIAVFAGGSPLRRMLAAGSTGAARDSANTSGCALAGIGSGQNFRQHIVLRPCPSG